MSSPIKKDTPSAEVLRQIMPEEGATTPVHKISSKVKGFSNLSPSEQIVFSNWKMTIEKIYRLHGFNPLDLSPFVNRKFLIVKAGIDRPIFSVNRLTDNSMTEYGIAFDHTVPLALWVRDHQKELSFPYKRYDISLSYREEELEETGRFNGFYQADVDIVGYELPLTCDAECITTLVKALLELEVPNFHVYINHIEIPKKLINKIGVKNKEAALRLLDKLEKTPSNEILLQLQKLEPEVPFKDLEKLVNTCSFRGDLRDFLKIEGLDNDIKDQLAEVGMVLSYIKKSGLESSIFKFAPGIVRGLDYYTGIVFETFFEKYHKFGSVASGGRYDKLVDIFTDKPTGINGVGGSIGFSRLFDVLSSQGEISRSVKTAAKVLILIEDSKFTESAILLASKLRDTDIPTDMYTGTIKGNRDQLRYAETMGIPYTVTVVDHKSYVIRDLSEKRETGDIKSVKEVVRQIQLIIKATDLGVSRISRL